MERRAWMIVGAGIVLLLAAALLSAARGSGALPAALLLSGGAAWTLAVILSWRSLTHYMARRSARYGLNAVVLSFLVLVILFLIGFVGSRHSWRVDLTAARDYSLSDKTLNVLQGVEKNIDIYMFLDRSARDTIRDLLREYSARNRQLRIHVEDLNKDPEKAEHFQVTSQGTVVFDAGDKVERIQSFGEEDITNALIKVSRPGRKKVYFLSEHGEKDITARGVNGYATAAEVLRRENYEPATLSLARAASVPQGCDVLVVAGAKSHLLDHEVLAVARYLEGGGRLLCLFDPRFDCGLEYYLLQWGVNVGRDRVVDPSPTGQLIGRGPSTPLVSRYGVHPITKQFRQPTYFPLVRSVRPSTFYHGKAESAVLAFTSENSWGESDIFGAKVSFSDTSDTPGPVPIAMAVRLDLTGTAPELESAVSTPKAGQAPQEKETLAAAGAASSHESRLVVFGDSDFASNESFADMGNGNLFLNSIAWLAQDEQLIAVRPKPADQRHVSLTKAQLGVLNILALGVVPGLIAALGAVVLLRRRARG